MATSDVRSLVARFENSAKLGGTLSGRSAPPPGHIAGLGKKSSTSSLHFLSSETFKPTEQSFSGQSSTQGGSNRIEHPSSGGSPSMSSGRVVTPTHSRSSSSGPPPPILVQSTNVYDKTPSYSPVSPSSPSERQADLASSMTSSGSMVEVSNVSSSEQQAAFMATGAMEAPSRLSFSRVQASDEIIGYSDAEDEPFMPPLAVYRRGRPAGSAVLGLLDRGGQSVQKQPVSSSSSATSSAMTTLPGNTVPSLSPSSSSSTPSSSSDAIPTSPPSSQKHWPSEDKIHDSSQDVSTTSARRNGHSHRRSNSVAVDQATLASLNTASRRASLRASMTLDAVPEANDSALRPTIGSGRDSLRDRRSVGIVLNEDTFVHPSSIAPGSPAASVPIEPALNPLHEEDEEMDVSPPSSPLPVGVPDLAQLSDSSDSEHDLDDEDGDDDRTEDFEDVQQTSDESHVIGSKVAALQASLSSKAPGLFMGPLAGNGEQFHSWASHASSAMTSTGMTHESGDESDDSQHNMTEGAHISSRQSSRRSLFQPAPYERGASVRSLDGLSSQASQASQQSFVSDLASEPEPEPEPEDPTSLAGSKSSTSMATRATDTSTSSSCEEVTFLARANHVFKPKKTGDVALNKGDVIDVTRVNDDSGFWFGEVLRTRKRGWFPMLLVDKLAPESPQAAIRGNTMTSMRTNRPKLRPSLPTTEEGDVNWEPGSDMMSDGTRSLSGVSQSTATRAEETRRALEARYRPGGGVASPDVARESARAKLAARRARLDVAFEERQAALELKITAATGDPALAASMLAIKVRAKFDHAPASSSTPKKSGGLAGLLRRKRKSVDSSGASSTNSAGGPGQDELAFAKGDMIVVVEKNESNGWWRGVLNGREGWFPCTLVEEIVDSLSPKSSMSGALFSPTASSSGLSTSNKGGSWGKAQAEAAKKALEEMYAGGLSGSTAAKKLQERKAEKAAAEKAEGGGGRKKGRRRRPTMDEDTLAALEAKSNAKSAALASPGGEKAMTSEDVPIPVDYAEAQLQTEFFAASFVGDVDAAVTALRGGVDVNSRNPDHFANTAMHYAVQEGHVALVGELLLRYGGDPNAVNEKGNSLMHAVTLSGDPEHPSVDLARIILRAGGDLNQRNRLGHTPLYMACAKGHLELCQYFVERGADVSACDAQGWTVLHELAVNANADTIYLVDFFVQAGADIVTADLDGNTPLHLACETCIPEVVATFIRAGGDPSIRNRARKLPYDLVCDIPWGNKADKSRVKAMVAPASKRSRKVGGDDSPVLGKSRKKKAASAIDWSAAAAVPPQE